MSSTHLAQVCESTPDYCTIDSVTYVNITVLGLAVLAGDFEVTCNKYIGRLAQMSYTCQS